MSSSDPVTGGAASDDDKEDESGGAWRFFREVAIVLVCALILSVVVRTFFVQAFYVPSASMENTLLINDRILASKITTRISGVNRGEVVVFKDPGGWLPPTKTTVGPVAKAMEFVGLLPSSSGDDLVKRVIGVAGDHVMCCDAKGQIVLNGVGLVEPYIKPGNGTDQVPFDIVVPADSIFVMGTTAVLLLIPGITLSRTTGSAGRECGGTSRSQGLAIRSIRDRADPSVPFDNPALNNQNAPTPTPSKSWFACAFPIVLRGVASRPAPIRCFDSNVLCGAADST